MSFAGFFVDEDTLALAGLPDVVHPGHPRLPDIPRETHDRVWIPIIARRGLILVTRDKRIRREPAERSAFENAGVRGFPPNGRVDVATGTGLPWPHQNTRSQGAVRDGRMDTRGISPPDG